MRGGIAMRFVGANVSFTFAKCALVQLGQSRCLDARRRLENITTRSFRADFDDCSDFFCEHFFAGSYYFRAPLRKEIAMRSMRSLYVLFASLLLNLPMPAIAGAAELPPGVKTLQVNGYDMAYLESGSGRPIVMVHGAINDYRAWAAQMEPFARSNRAIAVSLRHYFPERWDGKGGSFSMRQHATDLVSFIKALNAGPVDVVGHSRGAYVSVELALAAPDLIRKLVLAEPALNLDDADLFGSRLQENPQANSAAERAAWFKSILNRFQEGDIDGGLEIFVDFVGGPGSWKNRPEAERQMTRDNAWTIKGAEEEQRRRVTCTELESIKAPVQLVGGALSPPTFGAILNVIERCLKNRIRVTIPNASHAMNRMNPAAFNSAVAEFLSLH
jgi:pimeloyl-ACP methyl ester carboxylesterase